MTSASEEISALLKKLASSYSSFGEMAVLFDKALQKAGPNKNLKTQIIRETFEYASKNGSNIDSKRKLFNERLFPFITGEKDPYKIVDGLLEKIFELSNPITKTDSKASEKDPAWFIASNLLNFILGDRKLESHTLEKIYPVIPKIAAVNERAAVHFLGVTQALAIQTGTKEKHVRKSIDQIIDLAKVNPHVARTCMSRIFEIIRTTEDKDCLYQNIALVDKATQSLPFIAAVNVAEFKPMVHDIAQAVKNHQKMAQMFLQTAYVAPLVARHSAPAAEYLVTVLRKVAGEDLTKPAIYREFTMTGLDSRGSEWIIFSRPEGTEKKPAHRILCATFSALMPQFKKTLKDVMPTLNNSDREHYKELVDYEKNYAKFAMAAAPSLSEVFSARVSGKRSEKPIPYPLPTIKEIISALSP